MSLDTLPDDLVDLPGLVVPLYRRVYDINAERHDPFVGDDNSTYSNNVWRNGWYQIEEACAEVDGYTTGRPNNSLVITKGAYRLHTYSCGSNEHVDFESFSIANSESTTKQLIARANYEQLSLFDQASNDEAVEHVEFYDLVILHAGNPDEGCCGVWLGAPLADNESTSSAWAWIKPLWLIERSPLGEDADAGLADTVRHDEMPEPEIEVEPIHPDETVEGVSFGDVRFDEMAEPAVPVEPAEAEDDAASGEL